VGISKENGKVYRELVYKYDPEYLKFLVKQFAIDTKYFPLASRKTHHADTVVDVRGVRFGGGGHFATIAGPCGLENRHDTLETAKALEKLGADVFRGFIWKGRTCPTKFQGVGARGIAWLKDVKEQTGLRVNTEIISIEHFELVKRTSDMVQIGARSMQNYELLKAVGRSRIPVLLKNSPGSGLDELLCAAEYILRGGNRNVILCLRGTKPLTGSGSRFTLDMCAFSILKHLTHLPVIGDPSHPADHSAIVPSVAMGIAACGADGLLIEVHGNPKHALTDRKQLLDYTQFAQTMEFIRGILRVTGRSADLYGTQ